MKITQLNCSIESLTDHMQRAINSTSRDFEPDFYAAARRSRRAGQAQASEEDNSETPVAPKRPRSKPSPPWSSRRRSQSPKPRSTGTASKPSSTRSTQRLDCMGPVNLDAIQEYDELEQRHTFLETQIMDLENSKTELLDVITKINTDHPQALRRDFRKGPHEFPGDVHRALRRWQGQPRLADESDPLESGIEIIAKPPGKQLQSITLLSGGEKTMTAVALLFSIYMVKPSPFCVLDEMDAPLDESNINRFIKILDRFVGQSQFVVITHNKRTIASADMLYGVTMEEHGVSKLVGVKFSKREASNEGKDIIGTANPDAAAHVPSVAETFGKSGDLHSERLQQA
ncbi:MAG: hypothetical protein QM796_02975 [Chthoniobacteraceae bacterium]